MPTPSRRAVAAGPPAGGARRGLHPAVRATVLPALAAALGRWAARRGLDPAREPVREDLERVARALVVRLVFLLQAEAAGRPPGPLAVPVTGPDAAAAVATPTTTAIMPPDSASTALWERLRGLLRLVDGSAAAAPPASAGPSGEAAVPEDLWLVDPEAAAVLGGLRAVAAEATDAGDLGHLYEALLALRLSPDPDEAGAALTWLDHRGDRKGGGVYYTRPELVDHLVRQAVAPAFAEHLERVAEVAATSPTRAAGELLGFAVLDPACGGGRFLVAAVEELAGQAGRFLARTPLPEVDAALARLRATAASGAAPGAAVDRDGPLRRLLLQRCVFGADLSPAGVEVARLCLEAATAVPGLPAADLARNLIVGDALVGIDWPDAFPGVFARANPGFDVVLGNPPWEEITVERLGFYGRFAPGLRSLPQGARELALGGLIDRAPGLADLLAAERERAARRRATLAAGGYPGTRGDPDLYKHFCRRYRDLLRHGGRLGVVLPRSAFSAGGSAGFRRWLFDENRCERIDFLVNRRLWAFQTHPQYTVALVAARRARPAAEATVRVAGTATSPAEWLEQARSPGLALAPAAFGPGRTVPLLRDEAEADLLARLRRHGAFPSGAGGRWRCFPVRELDETNDRWLWAGDADGAACWPLWKGESFEQYDPRGAGARPCPATDAALARARKRRPGGGSALAGEIPLARRRLAVLAELDRARVAFRDVSRATDSRTVRACLVPPRTFLTNKAPYLAFVDGDERAQATCLGIMNSLPFDWQARRFVEINLNFFVLEGLAVPGLDDSDAAEIARCAARLSCPDRRFARFAAAVGVEAGPLPAEERAALRLEIDARVARAWGLTHPDLDVLLADFTLDAVPGDYRAALGERLDDLLGRGPAVSAAAPPG